MSVNYPQWVPEAWIEAETLWEKANALEIFDEENIGAEFTIDGYGPKPLTDVHINDYPVAGHDLTKVEANFGPYEVGQYVLQVTWDNEAEEIKSASLHEARHEDFKWRCDPDDITLQHEKNGRRDNPYGQTD